MRNLGFFLFVILLCSSCGKELVSVEPDGFFADPRDSVVYPFADIGSQTWMMMNMQFETPKGSYIYDNDDRLLDDYGRLYTFDAAAKACPDSWHVPSDKEWKDLEIYLGMEINAADSVDWRRSGEVALALKNQSGWWSGGNGANTSKFSALPGGFRTIGGAFEIFGDLATYWSSTWSSEDQAWGRALIYYEVGVYRWKYDKREGYSVRCIHD